MRCSPCRENSIRNPNRPIHPAYLGSATFGGLITLIPLVLIIKPALVAEGSYGLLGTSLKRRRHRVSSPVQFPRKARIGPAGGTPSVDLLSAVLIPIGILRRLPQMFVAVGGNLPAAWSITRRAGQGPGTMGTARAGANRALYSWPRFLPEIHKIAREEV